MMMMMGQIRVLVLPDL